MWRASTARPIAAWRCCAGHGQCSTTKAWPPSTSPLYVHSSSPLWLGAPATALARLDRIQVRAVRIMGRTEGIKLQSLGHRRGVAALCVMHRLLSRKAPPPLHSLAPAPIPAGRRVSERTRVPPALVVPSTTKPAYWQTSFVPKLTHAWNTLVPPALRLIRERQHFKKSINLSTDLSFL
jgi:hypothetical protein